jgi:hypothetical protein
MRSELDIDWRKLWKIEIKCNFLNPFARSSNKMKLFLNVLLDRQHADHYSAPLFHCSDERIVSPQPEEAVVWHGSPPAAIIRAETGIAPLFDSAIAL